MKNLYVILFAILFLINPASFGQQVIVTINSQAEKKPVSPYIFGKNNSLSDNPSDPLSSSEWQRLHDMGIQMFRENGGNNATKYNWRRKLSSHPDWYNNVYFHDWDYAAASLQSHIPSAQGMWAFQLVGKAAGSTGANFNDWSFNNSQWWSGTGQNLAGGGQVNTAGGGNALVDGNPALYLENWNADSTTGILDHWFGSEGTGLDPDKIRYWSMDNEPEIWDGTHDDVWPEQPSAEDFMQMYFATAKKARAKFPGIKLVGPVPANEWQWYNWKGGSISYNGKNYVWLEYFIKRIAEEQQASGIRLLDVLDIHFYPGDTTRSGIMQLHRVFFDETYNYPDANGVRRLGTGGWDTSIKKEYIMKRCSDWLTQYMGADHGVKFSVTETAIAKRNNPSLTACWYASTLGEFAKHGVEIFTPWDWPVGMAETVHLFTHFGESNILPAVSSDEYYVSAYPTINNAGDSMTIFLVNRHLSGSTNVRLNVNDFFIRDGAYKLYSLADLPVSETFVSHASNALNETEIEINDNIISLDLDALSVSALVITKHNGSVLIDSLATQATNDLYNYLQLQYGERIISGQTHDYYNQLKNVAEKSPMLRAGDFQHFTQGYPYLWVNGIGHTYGYDDSDGTVNSLINWYNSTGKKGIVSMHWHWHDPLGDSTSNVSTNTFYTNQTSFDIRRAVIPGTLEYNCVIRDIDSIAFQLKKFQSAGIPVLWRPLHEAGGAWFWWGAHGAEPCLALWDILIDRLKNYHQLHNLIWVWSSPESDWYPGNDKVDIIGYDSYPGNFNYTNQKSMFDNLYMITQGEKLIAMTENGPIPDPDLCLSGGAPWLFFMSWSDLVIQQNTEEHIKAVYNNPVVLSIESLSPPKYNVTIRVLRDLTYEPLSLAVLFGGENQATDDSGEVHYTVGSGTYDYLIQKTSYQSSEGIIDVISDTAITVLLLQTHANLRIRLREDTKPINNALVVLEQDSLYSSSLGDAFYGQLPVSMTYTYLITKSGYEERTGNVYLSKDTMVLVPMSKIPVSAGSGVSENEFAIWPNPAYDQINISIPAAGKKAEIRIMSLSGAVIRQLNFDSQPLLISVSDLLPGIYILQVTCESASYKGYFLRK